MSQQSLAVIDIGTNSTNLLVVNAQGDQVLREVVTTRLGESLHTSGELSAEAIARTVDTIDNHVRVARSHGAQPIVAVGTAACRRARNTQQFLAEVLSRTGITVEVLSEQQEASLAFTGAMSGLPQVVTPTLVLDIGGGSTEYTLGVLQADQSASIPFGAVTSTASHFSTDPPLPEDLTNLIGAVSDELEEIGRTMPGIVAPTRVVGVGGTIATIAAVEIGLAVFDDSALHGFELTRDAAEDVFRTLATEPLADRILNPGLSRDRADIIVAGCCILVSTMRRLKIDAITVSSRSLLDGVATRERLKQ